MRGGRRPVDIKAYGCGVFLYQPWKYIKIVKENMKSGDNTAAASYMYGWHLRKQ